MPLLAGTVTFARFQAELPKTASTDTRRWLSRALKQGAFQPLDPAAGAEDRSAGFVELEDHDSTTFAAGAGLEGEYALFGWRVDQIKIPAPQLKAELGRWLAKFEQEHGRKATRGEKAHAKDAIRGMLRQRTPPTSKVHDVSLSWKTGAVQVWAASRGVVDEISEAIESAFEASLSPRNLAGLAGAAGLEGKSLAPTGALLGVELSGAEVDRGEA
ncbi:MAG TPA: recombination-associated protein RdgC [Anaeromyxobacteraceae bacterium]|jgi:recombination associated protein RdgC|nr:recombination-associated protein RdgC [Anaeromyxobacteraceae bacterium]